MPITKRILRLRCCCCGDEVFIANVPADIDTGEHGATTQAHPINCRCINDGQARRDGHLSGRYLVEWVALA